MTSTNHTSNSLTKLSSGKRKLVSKSRITNPIPMLDLMSDEDEQPDVENLVKDPFKGISKGTYKTTIQINNYYADAFVDHHLI